MSDGTRASNGPVSARSDEGRHHRESTASVRLKAQRLRRALDGDRLDDAVRVAADVAAELRSGAASELSPKAYYDVFLSVCAELRLLEMYVMESARRGAPVLELYERVQETPLVLPRLYLLVTAGSVYVRSLQAPAKDVLRDLVEMCAGVQHPQRGLFLRAYLAQMMKDKLPDAAVEEGAKGRDASGGTVQDSIDFVIRNFTEMNRLWVRMQHDCSPREMEIREKERLELRLLVGSNIATLSRLVGSNLSVYRRSVLPAVLEQIVGCNDAIAQEYLADCVAQVFPDEFQLETLEMFMGTCAKLVKGVNMRTILVSIIDRLRRFAASGETAAAAARAAGAFDVFREHLPGVVRRQGMSLVLTDRLRIYESLMAFALQAEPTRLDYADAVLGFCVADAQAFRDTDDEAARRGGDMGALRAEDERLAMAVLVAPLEAFRSVGAVLQLENFVVLQRLLGFERQRSLAARVLVSSSGFKPCISSARTLQKLFDYVAPLVRDGPSGVVEEEETTAGGLDGATLSHHHEYLLASLPVSAPARATTRVVQAVEEDEGVFVKNQELVARIVYLCVHEVPEEALALYTALRAQLRAGGERRLPITLPSLVLAALRLALRAGAREAEAEAEGEGEEEGKGKGGLAEAAVAFAAETITALPATSAPLALRLRLHVATTAASLPNGGLPEAAYDSLAAAFVLYEHGVARAKEQYTALSGLICALHAARTTLGSRFEALGERATLHARRALTRSDQCALLCLVAELRGERGVGCVREAAEAAGLCAEVGERVFLWLDVATCAVRLQEGGVRVCVDGVLEGVLRGVRGVVSGRGAKGSALGKVAAARYQRVVCRVRNGGALFSGVDFAEI